MKRFLKSNKIYFETITTVLLGLMAIIISIISFRVSERQYKLNYYESRPEFSIYYEEVQNDTSSYEGGLKLIINKTGGKAKNITIRVATFAVLTIIHNNPVEEKKRKLIANFYDRGASPKILDRTTYVLTSSKNSKNFLDLWIKIKKSLEDSVYKRHYSHCETQFIDYIEITYLNFENEIYKEYYEMKNGQGFLIDNDKGLQVFYDYDKQLFLRQAIWLKDINKTDVNSLITELFEMKPYTPAKEDLLLNHNGQDQIYKKMRKEK